MQTKVHNTRDLLCEARDKFSIGTLSVFKSASERFEPLNLLCLVRLGKIMEDFPLTVPIDVQEAQNKKPVTAVC